MARQFFCIAVFILLLGAVTRGSAMARSNPATFSAREWSSAFAAVRTMPLSQRVTFWADALACGSTYQLDPLGEGHGNPPDQDPLCDFLHVDCLTFVEEVYALALSHSEAEFPGVLQHIRYTDGQLAYRWRNHYTVADWLPANAWFIRDVTDEVGTGITCSMTKTISRNHFFAQKGLTQYADIPDETTTTSYIPRTAVAAALPRLKTGDMIIFVISTPGIFAGHTGLIRVEHGEVYLQHASQTAKHVVTVPLAEYLRHAPARFVGFKIARPFV